LAERSTLGVNTIRRAEATDHATALTNANDLAIRRALETAGVEFIDENGAAQGYGSKSDSRRKRPSRNYETWR
jgi:hypothetical protein